MNLLDTLLNVDSRAAAGARLFGVVVGVVTNNKDEQNLGRVKVRFPWLSETEESNWARIASPGGTYFLPEVDDEVLVAFEHGDLRFPYVLGALWNGKDAPPLDNADGKNNLRVIKSRSGHVVRLNDEDGKETIEIVDMSEKNSIVIDTHENTITITSEKDIVLKAPNGDILLDAKTLTLKSSAAAKFEAGGDADVKASGTLNVKGSTVNIN